MQTTLTTSAAEAAAILNAGGVVAFPTETVYGLGASICHTEAIKQIFRAKGRPGDNPLIVHIATVEQLADVVTEITPDAARLIERFFPGPLTLVLRKHPRVPEMVTAGLQTVGIRCPSHAVAREFLRLAKCAVAAPSANLSGLPSATNWEAVYHDLNGKIDAVLRGTPSAIGLESTIVDCSCPTPLLLRAGAITLEQLQEVVPNITVATKAEQASAPKSPGLKYPHYAPKATIILYHAGEIPATTASSASIGFAEAPTGVTLHKQCATLDDYGHELFSFFRRCDAEGIATIFCELPTNEGLGRAIRDRLMRAAGHD